MTTEIATYLKFANIQMAAEALYGKKDSPVGDKFVGPIADLKVLTDGNERSSRFTATQAEEFSKDWTVVEHITGNWH